MNPCLAISRRETALCLRSPATWFALAALAAAFSPHATDLLARLAPFAEVPVEKSLPIFFLKALVLGPFVCAYFASPLFTREKAAGTLETLLTAPVSDVQVVLGKTLSACFCSTLALAVAATAATLDGAIAAPLVRSRALFATTLTLILLATVWNAFGVLLGVLCHRTPAVTFFSLLFSLGLSCAAVLTRDAPWSLFQPLYGMVDSRPFPALLSATVFLLFCAVRLLEARRWTRTR